MRVLRRGMVFLIYSMLLATLSSCFFIQKMAGRQEPAVDAVVRQAQAHITAGDYRKAFDLYSAAFEKYSDNTKLRDNYIRAGEQVRNAGDVAFQKKDYADAGGVYAVLLKSGIFEKDLRRSLSFDADYVGKQIVACAEGLLEKGLMKYREGNLGDAVSTWKKALALDPGNKDIKNMIETATTQLQNLKNMK